MLGRLGNTIANLWNKEAIVKVGGWDEALKSSQEYDLMFRILKKNQQLVFDLQPLSLIRQRASGSISQQNIEENWKRYISLRVGIRNFLREKNISSVELEEAANQSLFDAIRAVYKYNSVLALKYYTDYIQKGFSPTRKYGTANSRIYILFYKIFGFLQAQRFSKMIKHSDSL